MWAMSMVTLTPLESRDDFDTLFAGCYYVLKLWYMYVGTYCFLVPALHVIYTRMQDAQPLFLVRFLNVLSTSFGQRL